MRLGFSLKIGVGLKLGISHSYDYHHFHIRPNPTATLKKNRHYRYYNKCGICLTVTTNAKKKKSKFQIKEQWWSSLVQTTDKWLIHKKRMQHDFKSTFTLVWSISGEITMTPFTHVFSFASCESKSSQAIPISICDAISAWLNVLIIIYYSNPNDFLLSGLSGINKLIFLRF